MKKLDLEQLGVQELNAVEIKETDGGFLIAAALILTAIFILASTEDAK
jgi:hypothetical protein